MPPIRLAKVLLIHHDNRLTRGARCQRGKVMTAKEKLAGRLLESAELHTEKANQIDDAYYSSSELRAFADECREAAAALMEAGAGEAEPVAWLHTMHMEAGQKSVNVTLSPDHGWGDRGVHYDASYDVTSQPLYASPPPVQPVVMALRWHDADVGEWVADGLGSHYQITLDDDDFVLTRFEMMCSEVFGDTLAKGGKLAEMQAAAQADYEKRILAALTAPPSPAPGVTDTQYRHAAEFTAKMCWRTDPPNANNKLTDSERLSAIKFHPTIKALGKSHNDLAIAEAAIQPAEQPDDLRTRDDIADDGLWEIQADKFKAEADRLRAELDEFKASNALKGKAFAEASARVRALEEGLEPFAVLAKFFEHMPDDGGSVMCNVALSAIRRARALLDGGE